MRDEEERKGEEKREEKTMRKGDVKRRENWRRGKRRGKVWLIIYKRVREEGVIGEEER